MTVRNRSTGKLQATTLFFAGNRPKSTVELGVTAAYVLNMCKMATVQIFLEHSNRDVHVEIGFVRNRTWALAQSKIDPIHFAGGIKLSGGSTSPATALFPSSTYSPTTVSLSTTAEVAVVSKGRYNWLSYWSPTMHKFSTVFDGRSATWPNFGSNASKITHQTCWLRHQAGLINQIIDYMVSILRVLMTIDLILCSTTQSLLWWRAFLHVWELEHANIVASLPMV